MTDSYKDKYNELVNAVAQRDAICIQSCRMVLENIGITPPTENDVAVVVSQALNTLLDMHEAQEGIKKQADFDAYTAKMWQSACDDLAEWNDELESRLEAHGEKV